MTTDPMRLYRRVRPEFAAADLVAVPGPGGGTIVHRKPAKPKGQLDATAGPFLRFYADGTYEEGEPLGTPSGVVWKPHGHGAVRQAVPAGYGPFVEVILREATGHGTIYRYRDSSEHAVTDDIIFTVRFMAADNHVAIARHAGAAVERLYSGPARRLIEDGLMEHVSCDTWQREALHYIIYQHTGADLYAQAEAVARILLAAESDVQELAELLRGRGQARLAQKTRTTARSMRRVQVRAAEVSCALKGLARLDVPKGGKTEQTP